MSDRQRLLRAVLRDDLPSFIAKCFLTLEPGRSYKDNWHIHHIAHHLRRLSGGDTTRLIVNMPPRYMKSIAITIAYSAWILGHDPAVRIICVSYSKELARKHALDFRSIVESPWYRQLFPNLQASRRGNRNTEFVTADNGYRFASSMGGSVLGRGADLIIIDDPIKADAALSEAERRRVNEFYDNTLYTRLNDKGRGAIVIVMQRLHADDLVGHVIKKDDWDVVTIPAIETEARGYRIGPAPEDVHLRERGEILHPERESSVELERARRILGSMGFSAQYQQDPIPPDGNAIKRDWIRYYDTPPPALDLVVASWDTASTTETTSDYSVGTVWGLKGSDIFLLDIVRDQLEVPDLRRRIVEAHTRHKAEATLIEDTDIGRALVQEFRRSGPIRPILSKIRYDKMARLLAQAPKFEAGQVMLPREAPWLATFLSELLAFPNGAHDDQVDSTSQALKWLSQKIAAGTPPIRPNPIRPLGSRIARPS
jgi:predicted phage terminase large subunit-like protein